MSILVRHDDESVANDGDGKKRGRGYLTYVLLPGSVNENQLQLGKQRQVWLISIADERVGLQVKLRDPSRTHAKPERFCGGDSLRRSAISSVCTFSGESECFTMDACVRPSVNWNLAVSCRE